MAIFSKKNNLLLATDDADEVVSFIRKAERNTSGEIRVFIESKCEYVNAMDRALEIFLKLEMSKTINRNAVLVYIAKIDRQIAIVGDEGIHEKVKDVNLWDESLSILKAYFKKDAFKEGIIKVVENIGKELNKYFPADGNSNRNEIPDEIVFGK
ncbi:MAG TPA: TPM domain-containing protein [Edaphocola sp.]|nr:TPM domain-containing protein [Edaphocola sp.]